MAKIDSRPKSLVSQMVAGDLFGHDGDEYLVIKPNNVSGIECFCLRRYSTFYFTVPETKVTYIGKLVRGN